MKYLLAIDAGTGSIRAVLFDTDANQIAIAQKEWHHIEENGIKNSMSFNFKDNWELIKSCIREVLKNSNVTPKDIVAVSATSFREGIVLYDKDKNELWAVANVDARAYKEVTYLKEQYNGIEERFYQKSGQTFALGAIPRILWVKNNKPQIYKKTAYISMINDWILFKLSDVLVSEPSNSGTSGIFNLATRNWEPNMMKDIGLKSDIFPPCKESGSVIGNVSKKVAYETGLSEKTKVVVGGGDVQLGSAGLGVTKLNQVAILGGSFWQQIVNIKSSTLPPKDMSIRVNPHVLYNQSQAEGITFFSGLVMRWFRDAFCDFEKIEAKKRNIDVYTLLEEKAKSVPIGSNGVLPIFSDSMNYKKWYHSAPSFINLNIDPNICNKAVMFRSLEENACIISKINLQKIKEFTNIEINEVVFAGGASKGDLWCQILSDVLGLKVKIPKITEATALGAAMCAGVGAKIYKNLDEASGKLVIWDKEYYPNLENTKIYEKIANKWQKVYKEELKLVDENLTSSMWKAPGL